MLLDHLEQVRQQPKESRKRFVFVWSLISTGIIVLVWLSVLFGQSYALRGSEESATEESIPTLETENIRDSFDSSNDFLGGEGILMDDDASDSVHTATSSASTTDELASTTKSFSGIGNAQDQEETPSSTEGSETPETPPLLWQ
jgi:hypothetical protein